MAVVPRCFLFALAPTISPHERSVQVFEVLFPVFQFPFLSSAIGPVRIPLPAAFGGAGYLRGMEGLPPLLVDLKVNKYKSPPKDILCPFTRVYPLLLVFLI